MRVAAVTMVYNESDFLPIWLAHNSRQVGAENCHVIDHGTDDGSVEKLSRDVSVITLPRSPQDDTKRALLVSHITSQLLSTYDYVIYSDVDEIVFPDPRIHSSLRAFCESNDKPVITAYGFELIQAFGEETNIDLGLPILRQRQWVRFTSPMCKPVLISEPVYWSPGFHSTNKPVVFNGLFLFHLRWFDYDIAMRRLQRTRAQPWVDPDAAPWQRLSNEAGAQMFLDMGSGSRNEGCSFFSFDPMLNHVANLVLASQRGRENEIYRISLDIWSNEIWRVPKALKSVF